MFSLPAPIAPHAGSLTAIYGWYPCRYNAKVAPRMGNYALLVTLGWNIAWDFLSGAPAPCFLACI